MADSPYTPSEVSNLIGLVDTLIRCNEHGEPDRGYEIYHPSAFGKCLRMMQYQRYEARGLINGETEQFGSKKLRLFAHGHQMHERWKNYFEDMGVLRGVWECRNPMCRLVNDDGTLRDITADIDVVSEILNLGQPLGSSKKCVAGFWKLPSAERHPRVYGLGELQGVFRPEKCVCGCKQFKYEELLVEDKELNFRGHADILLDFSRFDRTMFSDAQKAGLGMMFDPDRLPKGIVVVDMKSVGCNQYKSVVQKTGPHKYYVVQLSIYINILKCDYGLLWYEEKDQFDTSVFKIENNPSWWEQIRKQALLMQEMADSPKPLLPPPRPISKSSSDCEHCAYKKFCCKPGGIWDDPSLQQKRQEFYGELL